MVVWDTACETSLTLGFHELKSNTRHPGEIHLPPGQADSDKGGSNNKRSLDSHGGSGFGTIQLKRKDGMEHGNHKVERLNTQRPFNNK